MLPSFCRTHRQTDISISWAPVGAKDQMIQISKIFIYIYIYCLPSQVIIFCPVFLTASKTIKDLARQNTYRVNLWHQPYMTSVGSRFCKNKISQNIGKLLGTCMHIFKIINLVFLRAVAFGFSFHTKKTLSASLELKQVVSVNGM